jgi:hypothetical protein
VDPLKEKKMPSIAQATGAGTIAEFLQPLERFGCRRLDGRLIPSSDVEVDHVLIAPPGVFVIGAKNWDGRLEVTDGVLRRDGLAQIDQVAALVAQASAVSSLLDSWTGESVSIPVHAVMTFVGPAQIDGWAALAGAHAVDGRSLAEFITKFPAAVGIEHVNWAYQALDDHLPIRIPAAPPMSHPAPVAAAPVVPLTLVPPIAAPPVIAAPPAPAVDPTPAAAAPPSPEAFLAAAAAPATPIAPAFAAPEPPLVEAPPMAPMAPMAPEAPVASIPAPPLASPPVMAVPMAPPPEEAVAPQPAPPVAVAPPMADTPRQAPNEPVVFLTRVTDAINDRFYVRDEEGYPGGYLDLHTGVGVGVSAVASTVFHQLLPAYLPEGGMAVDQLPLETQAAIRHYLGGQTPMDSDDLAVVACAEGHFEGRPRLFASLLQSGGRRTDLGWIDLIDRRTSTDVPGVDPILRYCGDAFLTVPPIS